MDEFIKMLSKDYELVNYKIQIMKLFLKLLHLKIVALVHFVA